VNYYIQYPIYIDCQLRCPYCFHAERFKHNLLDGPNFEWEKYIKWRNTHIGNADDIIMHFHGGEPSTDLNQRLLKMIMPKFDKEKFDFLSNGLGDDYGFIKEHKDRIHRVGFTYHRKVIKDNKELQRKFINNVCSLKDFGLNVYVKELLFTDLRNEIAIDRHGWGELGVPHKIQDFKGYAKGEDFSEFTKYTPQDIAVIDTEYKHDPPICECMRGYKTVIIRGGWQGGDILGCWIDPVIVGSIHHNTYNPNYTAEITPHKGLEIVGVEKNYAGTYIRDREFESGNYIKTD
jgi:hypothetical protein